MTRLRPTIAFIVAVALLAPHGSAADQQPPPEIWRQFAEQVDLGSELRVRLRDGQRFRATLVAIQDTGLLLLPKTRIPVDVQPVPYDAIRSLERERKGGGMSAGKAAAIGVGSGIGAFFAIMLILVATLD
jgi:hypothetical protein